MDINEIIKQRHSVRRFTDKPIDAAAVAALNREITACNAESGFNIQLITDEPEAFAAERPSYGQFSGCRNYVAVIGPKDRDADAGYYGERIVLEAQKLGINSCWVALTYRKGKVQGTVGEGEKRYPIIALGYGVTQGEAHKSKKIEDVSDFKEGDPAWYKTGVESALLAPTAVNQQKFRFERAGDRVTLKTSGFGFYTKVDLGIVKYHFDISSGRNAVIAE